EGRHLVGAGEVTTLDREIRRISPATPVHVGNAFSCRGPRDSVKPRLIPHGEYLVWRIPMRTHQPDLALPKFTLPFGIGNVRSIGRNHSASRDVLDKLLRRPSQN